MKYLLDTDTCIYYLNKNEAVISAVEKVAQEELAISLITLAELQFGAYNSNQVERNLKRVSFFENSVQVLGLDSEITLEYARIRAELRKTGTTIDDFDLLIAATALINNLTLVTNNVRHFEKIGGLALDNWVLFS